MPEAQCRIRFEPNGRVVYALPGTKLLEAAAQAGLIIDTPCGSSGACGKCRIRITSNLPEPSPADEIALTGDQLAEGWRLACQTRALPGEMVVYVPDSSLFGSHHQILATSETQAAGPANPAVRKEYVELTQPTLTDDAPDVARLEQAIGACEVDMPFLRALPHRLRDAAFKGTAVLAGKRLIDFEAGDTTATLYGAAFDVGTTTIVGVLLDLRQDREIAVEAGMNPQVSFGDDVLSRIAHAATPEGLEDLRAAVLGRIRELLQRLCEKEGIAPEQVHELVFSGNTTMETLLCGIDPTQLGQVPFVPAYARGLRRPAHELGIPIHPRGEVYVFPVIGGFVGGDTVAGLLTTQITELEGATLLIDVGTNGEIVLCHEGRLLAASTAAGPAFEGARISCGMRATTGAIEKVLIDEKPHYGVIGNVPPTGICGSGLIDLCAQLLKCGVIAPNGRLLPPNLLPETVPPAVAAQVRADDNGAASFVLSEEAAQPVMLLQQDVRELQLASGAIRAGVAILLKRAGLDVTALERVLVAGGFGSFIRRNNAQRIGLLPPEIDHNRIDYVGNASLGGARWAAVSEDAMARAEALARQAEHVELSTDPDFAMEFAMAMAFPEPATAT